MNNNQNQPKKEKYMNITERLAIRRTDKNAIACYVVGGISFIIGMVDTFAYDTFASSVSGPIGLAAGVILAGIGMVVEQISRQTFVLRYMADKQEEKDAELRKERDE